MDAVHEIVRKVLAGEPIEPHFHRLIAPGVTMGGARPKALFQLDGAEWIVKFAEQDRPAEPLIEHAAMTLAAKADIDVAVTPDKAASRCRHCHPAI
jgi:serine/threonine-protein kinase HipA